MDVDDGESVGLGSSCKGRRVSYLGGFLRNFSGRFRLVFVGSRVFRVVLCLVCGGICGFGFSRVGFIRVDYFFYVVG